MSEPASRATIPVTITFDQFNGIAGREGNDGAFRNMVMSKVNTAYRANGTRLSPSLSVPTVPKDRVFGIDEEHPVLGLGSALKKGCEVCVQLFWVTPGTRLCLRVHTINVSRKFPVDSVQDIIYCEIGSTLYFTSLGRTMTPIELLPVPVNMQHDGFKAYTKFTQDTYFNTTDLQPAVTAEMYYDAATNWKRDDQKSKFYHSMVKVNSAFNTPGMDAALEVFKGLSLSAFGQLGKDDLKGLLQEKRVELSVEAVAAVHMARELSASLKVSSIPPALLAKFKVTDPKQQWEKVLPEYFINRVLNFTEDPQTATLSLCRSYESVVLTAEYSSFATTKILSDPTLRQYLPIREFVKAKETAVDGLMWALTTLSADAPGDIRKELNNLPQTDLQLLYSIVFGFKLQLASRVALAGTKWSQNNSWPSPVAASFTKPSREYADMYSQRLLITWMEAAEQGVKPVMTQPLEDVEEFMKNMSDQLWDHNTQIMQTMDRVHWKTWLGCQKSGRSDDPLHIDVNMVATVVGESANKSIKLQLNTTGETLDMPWDSPYGMPPLHTRLAMAVSYTEGKRAGARLFYRNGHAMAEASGGAVPITTRPLAPPRPDNGDDTAEQNSRGFQRPPPSIDHGSSLDRHKQHEK